MIEPCDLADEIHPVPFEPVDLPCAAAGRECEPHDRFHVPGQGLDQSVCLLASQEAHAPAGFLRPHRYLTSYKGLYLLTRSSLPIELPRWAEVILVRHLRMPA